LRQTSKGSRRWQKPQKRKKTLTPSDWISFSLTDP
jgi:hypothetical protein